MIYFINTILSKGLILVDNYSFVIFFFILLSLSHILQFIFVRITPTGVFIYVINHLQQFFFLQKIVVDNNHYFLQKRKLRIMIN